MTTKECIINLLSKGFLYTSLPACDAHLSNLVCEMLNTDLDCNITRNENDIVIVLPFEDCQMSVQFHLRNSYVSSIKIITL